MPGHRRRFMPDSFRLDWAIKLPQGRLVWAPSTMEIETNRVTDTYSLSLAADGARSQIVDLDDPLLAPKGWQHLAKPPLAAPEDVVIYALILYNVGCVYSRAGEIDDALNALEHSVDEGLGDPDWMENDSDLDPLRNYPRFQALLKRLRQEVNSGRRLDPSD